MTARRNAGVTRTYKGTDGYAPIGAYLGQEGWYLELELREGKQHSQCNFIPFLDRVMAKARTLTSRNILVCLDSAHDALDSRVNLAGWKKVSYIIKCNPCKEDPNNWVKRIFAPGKIRELRPGKKVGILRAHLQKKHEGTTYQLMRVMRAVERSIDKKGQILIIPEMEVEDCWTTRYLSDKKVIALYNDHTTSEQLHREIKSDMDMERLPSGKFATNALILAWTCLAYNILRFIGQLGLTGEKSPARHSAKRRRIKTFMQELMYLAARHGFTEN